MKIKNTRNIIWPFPAYVFLILLFLTAISGTLFTQPLSASAACVGGYPNGLLEPGEECDDGNYAIIDDCSPDCLTQACVGGEPNGVVEEGEECDDGNDDYETDICSNQCRVLTCMDNVSYRSNVCTANDVRLSTILNDTPVYCEIGTTVDLLLSAMLRANADERWDIGMFIALDGGLAQVGKCYQDYLPPPLAPLR